MKARYTIDWNNIPDEAAYQADLEPNTEIVITDDIDVVFLTDESNVLIDAFVITEENDIEYKTEPESEYEEDWSLMASLVV